MNVPFLTVFTPTYNRAHTLPGVFKSLSQQTCLDFEWLVVDDASEDETGAMVQDWMRTAPFPVRYFRQPRGGKHRAANTAAREARGECFLAFDSDDACVPEAVERFKTEWENIPPEKKERLSTLCVLSMDGAGHVVGKRYPGECLDVDDPREQFLLRSGGERWGINRTDLLRTHPYPEIPGELFLPDGVVWNRLALRYSARFIDEPLRIYRHSADGIMASRRTILAHSPRGSALYYRELSALQLPAKDRIKALLNCGRYSLHAGAPFRTLLKEPPGAPAACAAYLLFQFDRL